MQIYRLVVRNFRGFDDFSLDSPGHVLLVGPSGAGRSDLIEGLRRVLHPDSTRFPLSEPLDFHRGNVTKRAEVEIVLGQLGEELEQRFFDQLEVWDRDEHELQADFADLEQLQDEKHEWVLRLCYRASWDAEEKIGDHWVDFAKTSDPDAEQVRRVSRNLREAIPFAVIQPAVRPLDLSARATFRLIVDHAEGVDFAKSLDELQSGVAELGVRLGSGDQVGKALERVLLPLRPRLNVKQKSSDVVRFLPEGGALGAIIRSLGASIDLDDGVGPLPLSRHGSTLRSLLAVAEALSAVGGSGGIVIADDFGEDMDAASAHHLAAVLRAGSGQVWLATRRATVADAFAHEETVRLVRKKGVRQAFRPTKPKSKQEKIAAQYINRLLLTEVASSALVIGEGPHDRESINGLARKRFDDGEAFLPAAWGVSVIDAGGGDTAGGGTGNVPKLADAARQLGFRTVIVIDHDKPGDDDALNACLAAADCVVRLPKRYGIEAALLDGLPDDVIASALKDIDTAFALQIPAAVFQLTGVQLHGEAIKWLHKGYHRQFIELLPKGVFPAVGAELLTAVVEAAMSESISGHIQL